VPDKQNEQPEQVVMGFTYQQLQDLIRGAVQEAKRPDAETEERLAAEKMRRERAKAEMVLAVQAEQDNRRRAQQTCQHQKERGESAVGGQINSDGLIHPICLRCQKEFSPYSPGMENVAQGLG
jgi:hypothetical protein